MKNLGAALKAWRDKRDLGVREMAKILGTSPATVSRIERGLQPDGKTLINIVKWLLACLVLFASASLHAQGWPRPAKTPQTDVICAGCEGASAGQKTIGWGPPVTGYVGRFLDSYRTGDCQQPFRTARANHVKVTASRVYMIVGSALVAYDRATFVQQLSQPMQPISNMVGSVANPTCPARPLNPEQVLPWASMFYAEFGAAGWEIQQQDGQERLSDFDIDDRGYIYLGYNLLGWGVVRDRAGFMESLSHKIPAGTDAGSDYAMAVRAGDRFYALVTGAGGAASDVFDVTDPTSPDKAHAQGWPHTSTRNSEVPTWCADLRGVMPPPGADVRPASVPALCSAPVDYGQCVPLRLAGGTVTQICQGASGACTMPRGMVEWAPPRPARRVAPATVAKATVALATQVPANIPLCRAVGHNGHPWPSECQPFSGDCLLCAWDDGQHFACASDSCLPYMSPGNPRDVDQITPARPLRRRVVQHPTNPAPIDATGRPVWISPTEPASFSIAFSRPPEEQFPWTICVEWSGAADHGRSCVDTGAGEVVAITVAIPLRDLAGQPYLRFGPGKPYRVAITHEGRPVEWTEFVRTGAGQ